MRQIATFYPFSFPFVGCQMSVICSIYSLFCGDNGEFSRVCLTIVCFHATPSCLSTGSKKWCIGCLWWEHSKDTSWGLFGQAAERTIEVFRLLIILVTSLVAFNLFWRNEWGKLIKSCQSRKISPQTAAGQHGVASADQHMALQANMAS